MSFRRVLILYHQDIATSTGYQTAPKEYQHAAEEGVEILENIRVLKLQSGIHQEVVGVWVQRPNGDEELIPCDNVLIATGVTQSNLYPDHLNVHKVGDLDPHFRGSVVKALYSGRMKALEIAHQRTQPPGVRPKRPSIYDIQNTFSKTIRKIDYLSDHYIKLSIYGTYLAQKGRPGHMFRFHSSHHIKGIPLSFYRSVGDQIELIIHMIGPATKALHNLKLNETVHVMGPVGQPFIPAQSSLCWVVKGAQIVLALSDALTRPSAPQKIVWLYEDEKELFDLSQLSNNAHVSVYPIHISHIDSLPVDPFDYVVSTLDPDLKKKLPCATHQWFYHKTMQCMMQGICGRCIDKGHNDKVRILCRGHV